MAQEPTQMLSIYAPREMPSFIVQYLATIAAEIRFHLILLRLVTLNEMGTQAIDVLAENSMNPSYLHFVPPVALPH
jgi:hypothetical protein